jgi:ATP-dependent helicase/nuclease subunit B
MKQANKQTTILASLCKQKPFAEKWLIAPTMRVGYQWVDQVAMTGQPVLNVRVKTLSNMILELMSETLHGMDVRLLLPLDGIVILSRLWGDEKEENGYLRSLEPSMALFQKLYAAIVAIRMAGLDAAQVDVAHFESERKGREIVSIVTSFLEAAEENQLIDYAGVVRLANQCLDKGETLIPDQVEILIPDYLRCKGVEQQFLARIRKHYADISVDTPYPSQRDSIESDLDLLQWLPMPQEAPASMRDKTANIFHAVGEINEVREVFRRCLAKGYALDEVEIVCSDGDTYIPLMYELSKLYTFENSPAKAGLPVTYADGIPARYSRPGRALLAWLDWVGGGYVQAALTRMIQDGLVQVRSAEAEGLNETRLAVLFRTVKIGLGRERYVTKLDESIAALQSKLETARMATGDEAPPDWKIEKLARDLDGLECLRTFVARLQEITPKGLHGQALLQAAMQFLESCALCYDELDNNSRLGLLREIKQMQAWITKEENFPIDILAWLRELPLKTRLMGMSPKHGHIHVSSLMHGGQSGRPYTFLVGLDDGRFPGSGGTDPILLDEERESLSEHLMTGPRRVREKLEQFYLLLCRLRGTVTMSYASYNVKDEREMFPSPVLFSAYRILSGEHEGDQSDMLKWLALPVSFAPAFEPLCLSESDWWLWKCCGDVTYANAAAMVAGRYPHLHAGQAAQAQRASDDFTVYDGFVREAGSVLDPIKPGGRAVSASALELLGKCPLAYFFAYALRLEPPDALAVDAERWLDPLEYGNLMHSLFENFLQEKIDQNEKIDFEHDHPRLQELLIAHIEKNKALIPPPNESAFQKQRQELELAATVFLKEEEQQAPHRRPVYLEAAIGLAQETTATDLDSREPVEVKIGDAASIRIKGKIDRVDRVIDGVGNQFAVWDYKSGGVSKYQDTKKNMPFRQGRIVQHLLYVLMAEQCLKAKIAPDAELVEFGFFFPGVKGRGERIRWSPQELTHGLNIIHSLSQMVSMGVFLATDQENDCVFCDYRDICRDVKAVTVGSKRKLANPLNVRLQPFRALRGKS